MKRITVLSFLLSAALFAGRAQTRVVSLNSSEPDVVWEIRPQADVEASGFRISQPGYDMGDCVKGVVPGTVFTAYVEAGREPDPDFGDNIYRVDEGFYNRPFWYRTEFETPACEPGQRIWLHFDGTNRFADFYFNGVKLSGTRSSTKDVSGHMIRTKYDITELVRKRGRNAVAVLITDADQKKTRGEQGSFGVAASPTYLSAAGWDWMPYVPGRLAGITGRVYLAVTGDVVMEDPWIRSELPAADRAELSLSVDLRNASPQAKTATVSGVIRPGNITFRKTATVGGDTTARLSIDKRDVGELVVRNPRLWWPNGYGEPNLYTCELTCTVEGRVTSERRITFGIREYAYEMVDNVAGMPVLTFFINGRKLFLKGGNWGMSEYLLRCHGDEYEKKIALHRDMNFNMIRLWTGCVTDDEFYDWCDRYGIMVWDDFWLYVAYNDVAQPEAFKANARDKVRRLRNHPSIALWCGANETRPTPELDAYLREMIAEEDHNDRMYKSCSNQDGLSGSGWWGNQPPRHHFETSSSNLAFNKPPYPYGSDRGYGLRSEIGTATFPTYESVREFIPADRLWPLPTDEQLRNDDDNVWNRHFFGKEASNANPVNYRKSVDMQFGASDDLEEFCEKAQLLNIEVVKGMYEAWNDKMWHDATGILLWMSQSAYPSFVWQTYDYYYDATGAYWGAKKACEPLHIQWNASNNRVKAVNTTSDDLVGATARATVYTLDGRELADYGQTAKIDVAASNTAEAFTLNFNPANLAAGKRAVASSSTKAHPASDAADGGAGSRWESDASDPQWLYVDLGGRERIGKVVVKWEAAYAREYELQVSDDATTWRSVYRTTDGQGGTDEIELRKPLKARYVRLLGLKRATGFGYSVFEIEVYADARPQSGLTPVHFIRLELTDADGRLVSDNFYWRNGVRELDYTPLNGLPEAEVSCRLADTHVGARRTRMEVRITNRSTTVAFANRLRLVDRATGERVLPLILSDNYITLLPGEERTVSLEFENRPAGSAVDLLLKQYGKAEKTVLTLPLRSAETVVR